MRLTCLTKDNMLAFGQVRLLQLNVAKADSSEEQIKFVIYDLPQKPCLSEIVYKGDGSGGSDGISNPDG